MIGDVPAGRPMTLVNGLLVDPTDNNKQADTTVGLTIVGERIGQHLSGPSSDHLDLADHLVIDADGLLICPGFIDLQINGGYGHDLVENSAGMWDLGSTLPQHGVTGFLPTIITSPSETYREAMKALADRPADYRGAEPLGLHFEGPMLNPARPGAHPPHHLKPPDMAVIEGWTRSDGVALVTLAPELDGADAVIAELVERGIAVSAGHSAATADDARRAAGQGVTMVTHLFNAMAPLHHRQPGLAGFALADRLDVGLIADGVHVDPLVASLVWRAKGPDQIVLVTDAVAPMGLGPGEYQFGEFTVIADDRQVQTANGTLAGSILTMDQAVRNMANYTGAAPSAVMATATSNPARIIGMKDRGCLRPGTTADLTLLDDQFNVHLTICGGTLTYVADEARERLGSHFGSSVEP